MAKSNLFLGANYQQNRGVVKKKELVIKKPTK